MDKILLGHNAAHVVGVQMRILSFLGRWHVDGQEFQLAVSDWLCHGEPDELQSSGSLPGPRERVESIGVANADGLDRHSRDEGARLESDEALAVGAGAFGENEYLLPPVVLSGRLEVDSALNLFDGVLPRIRVFTPHVDGLSVVDELCTIPIKSIRRQEK